MQYNCYKCGVLFNRDDNKGIVLDRQDICDKCANILRAEQANNDIFYNKQEEYKI